MATKEPFDPEFESLIRHIQESRGLDFRGYKRTSLQRRVRRRMEEVGCKDYLAYHNFLEAHPQEFVDLLNTVLINVTSFFRDRDAWEVVRTEVAPRIIARKTDGTEIRVWSVGCASGEEAYSLAMLFAEALGVEATCRQVKIYATDLDEEALRAARHAVYGPREVEGLPPAMLERYFERTSAGYAFQRELRKCVIFGRHNIVHDAPISKIDLLTCRNLLIYLESETQDTVLPRLHYALVDDGFLFLGKAETQLARSKLFDPVDLKCRIFRKIPQGWRRSLGGSVAMLSESTPDRPDLQAQLHEAIVDGSITGYLAINTEGLLIFANATARRLLEIGEADMGRPFQDLAISYRPAELRSRIDDVRKTGRPVRLEHQEYRRPPAEPLRLSIEAAPLSGRDGRPFAVLLSFTDTTLAFKLQQELGAAQQSLEATIEELQSTNEELETTNEELQSTNEELETTNEELQSTNEELETMNEELRSTNEELEIANGELCRQTEEAGEYRRYSEAILRSIDNGVIVLDPNLKVRSWNRWSENVWGVRAEEVLGLPFHDLDIGLPVTRLMPELKRALAEGTPLQQVDVDAMDRRGRQISCRIRLSPLRYNAREARGAVLIIENITERQREETLSSHLGRVIGQSLNAICFLDAATFQFRLINKGAERRLGHTLEQLRQIAAPDLMPAVSSDGFQRLVAPLIAGERTELVLETMIETRGQRTLPMEIHLQYFGLEEPPILVALLQDLSERQRLETIEDQRSARDLDRMEARTEG